MSSTKGRIDRAVAEEIYPGILWMEGYEDCVIGICLRFGQDPTVVYDMDLVLDRLRADGMSDDEADDYFLYNQLGAWMGPGTPCFLDRSLVEDE